MPPSVDDVIDLSQHGKQHRHDNGDNRHDNQHFNQGYSTATVDIRAHPFSGWTMNRNPDKQNGRWSGQHVEKS
jgi:hypothetical protein